jgi:hypothetical protein
MQYAYVKGILHYVYSFFFPFHHQKIQFVIKMRNIAIFVYTYIMKTYTKNIT